MKWEIRFPVQDRDDPLDLGHVHDLAREAIADEEERSVVQQVAVAAVAAGADTFGDVLDQLEAAGPAGRRQVLDSARERAGLLPTRRAEAVLGYEMANETIKPQRDQQGRSYQSCHAPGCAATPVDHSGQVVPVPDRKWFCQEHKHFAQDGDAEPPEPRYAITPTFGLRAVGAELERLEAEDAKRREEAEARRARQQAELAAIEGARERYRAEAIRTAPDVAGVPQERLA